MVTSPVLADRTKLLEVDLKTGARRNIDGGGKAKTRADLQLDALLDSATGGAAFSTQDLERIEKALRRFLQASRPRATPRLLLFLYPGRISRAGLKELRDVLVEIDLVVDPCGRTVCRESVAKHIELLGKAMRQAVVRTDRYTIKFKTITIRTTTDLRGEDGETYRFSADEVVQAGRGGGGRGLVQRITKAKSDYAGEMTKAIARRVKGRRVALLGAPRVQRSSSSVSVSMEIRSDRNRYRSHVGQAMAGAAEALGKSSLTPPSSQIEVVALIRFRKQQRRRFTCMGQPLKLHLAGRMPTSELWSTYITERKKGGTQLSFSDEEAAGGVASDGGDFDPDRVQEILAAHVSLLAPCLQAEARRSRRFSGVTLKFAVSGAGRATHVSTRERVSSKLLGCLKSKLDRLRFGRHGGSPQRVEYPMYIQR